MTQLKKSIQKLLKMQQKQQLPPKLPSKSQEILYSQYALTESPQQSKKVKVSLPAKGKALQIMTQNTRLFKKLSTIQHRKSKYQNAHQNELYSKIYALNIASRKLQRRIKEESIQHQNNQFIERIIKIRTNRNLPLQQENSLSKNKESNKRARSVMLPPIKKIEIA